MRRKAQDLFQRPIRSMSVNAPSCEHVARARFVDGLYAVAAPQKDSTV